MKKLINIFLFILFVISVFLALRFSTLPILNQLPNGIKEYFTLTTAELEENVFWYDFCMGVLVSYIFYILVEVLPEYIRVKKAKKILCEHINLIMEDLKMIIEIVYHIYGLEIKKDDVAIKKLISIDGNTKQEEGYYNEDIYKKNFFCIKDIQE